MATSLKSHGQMLTVALEGSWRAKPVPSALSVEELSEVSPLLLGSGAAALGWWKTQGAELESSPAAQELQQAFRYQTIRAALLERDIEQVFTLLNREGIEALLVKGWAAARLYPEQGLRPWGDIDLCVRPEHFKRAALALEGTKFWVDMHAGFGEDATGDFHEAFERGERVCIGAASARVPCAEDHLRLMCLHLLRHGAWRPLWLCDVAAALESGARGVDFSWERVLGADKRRARWVACAVGLAETLLGADTRATPFEGASKKLPRWLVPEVLKQWETPFALAQAPMRYRAPMRKYLSAPQGLLEDLKRRWPNPIEATVRVGGPLNELPRWPFQLASCLKRTTRFVAGAGRA